ncbi:MAG: hypothetical protein AAB550_03020 [Patescibacteria group bacterium]
MTELKQPYENYKLDQEGLKYYYNELPWLSKTFTHVLDDVLGFIRHPLESGIRAIGYLGLLGAISRVGLYIFVPESRPGYTSVIETALWSIGFIVAADVMKIARNSKNI